VSTDAPPLFDRQMAAAVSASCTNTSGFATDSPGIIAGYKIFGTTLVASFRIGGFFPKGPGTRNPHLQGVFFAAIDGGPRVQIYDFPSETSPLVVGWKGVPTGRHRLLFGLENDQGTVFFQQSCFSI
jgi:hypothetical protein